MPSNPAFPSPGDLVLRDLACDRGGRRIFAGLTLTAAAGTAQILKGPNGSGKSSLLRVLAGLVSPAAGDAEYGGAALARDRTAFQANALYAGHLDALKPNFTAAQTLAFWARCYGAPIHGVAAALAAMGLSALADTPTRVLSAGQKRRLGLARLALIRRPLWLLDEPTVSLDAASTVWVAELARAHLNAGGIALIATHIDLGLGGVEVTMEAFRPTLTAAEPIETDYWL